MNISKSLIACAITLANAHSAHAIEFNVGDINFNPYARLVGGIDYVNHAYEAGISGSKVEVAGNQWGTSYFGLAMSVPLMDKWVGIGRLESGFGTDTGATSEDDVLFNRAAYVGVKHEIFGQLTAGTHLVIAQDMIDMDPMAFQSIGINTLVNGANDGAADNSVQYRSAEFYGLSAAYMHQFGGEVGAPKRASGDGVTLVYRLGNAKLRALYQTRTDDFSRYTGGAFYGLGSQGQWLYVKNTALAGSYDFGPAKLFVGYQRIEAPDAGHGLSYTFDDEAKMGWVGVNYQVTDKLTLLGAAYQVKQTFSNKKTSLFTAGMNYEMNDYFTFYSTLGYISNNEVAASLVSSVGDNNHALSYDEVSCEDTASCNGSNQLGGYTGVVFKF
ncbi:porin [Aeromonas sp.]|uniref:porin n=1 Tax=Aeromonas sp. TaxID=647 RepID=UPI002905FF42|nr:porin [Aeromonas sp.]MDU7582802.1 porin [Aeromonas sp.]